MVLSDICSSLSKYLGNGKINKQLESTNKNRYRVYQGIRHAKLDLVIWFYVRANFQNYYSGLKKYVLLQKWPEIDHLVFSTNTKSKSLIHKIKVTRYFALNCSPCELVYVHCFTLTHCPFSLHLINLFTKEDNFTMKIANFLE